MFFGLFKKKADKAAKKTAESPAAKEALLGDVSHYFPHCKACVVKLKTSLDVGEKVHIVGHTTDLTEDVTSMQIDGQPITSAKKGQEIGLLVKSRVRPTDKVYKILS